MQIELPDISTTRTPEQQVLKIREESRELLDESIDGTKPKMLAECFDVIQACYTFLGKYSQSELEAARKAHIEKIKAREMIEGAV